MEATGGKGVDVVYEHVGGELFQKGLDCLKFSGRLVTCGAHAQEVVDFDIIPFFRGQKSVIGSFVYDRDEFEKVLELADRGQITPLVDSTFPLDQAKEAMERMESRELLREDRPHAVGRRKGDRGMKRVGVDVGGTFTDLIYVDDEAGRDPRPQASDDARRSVAGHGPGHS